MDLLEMRVREGVAVLDLGCGCGVPVARRLARRYAVTGVDLSPVQVERARTLVPNATFICADMAALVPRTPPSMRSRASTRSSTFRLPSSLRYFELSIDGYDPEGFSSRPSATRPGLVWRRTGLGWRAVTCGGVTPTLRPTEPGLPTRASRWSARRSCLKEPAGTCSSSRRAKAGHAARTAGASPSGSVEAACATWCDGPCPLIRSGCARGTWCWTRHGLRTLILRSRAMVSAILCSRPTPLRSNAHLVLYTSALFRHNGRTRFRVK